MGDHLRHTAAEQGQEEHLVHAGEARPDVLGKAEDIQRAGGQTHDAGSEDADGQDQEHVHAHQSQDQNQQIGHDLDDAVLQHAHLGHHVGTTHDQQHDDGDDGGRQGDEEVHAELIAHLAALAAGGGDGSIGDHGQVVAEHGAAHAGTQHQGDAQAGLVRNADGDGNDGADGAHGGTGGSAHERGDDEHAGSQEVDGDQAQAQVDGGIAAAHGSCHAGEGTGQQIDHQHGQHVLIGRALGKDLETLVDAALGHGKRHQQGNEHSRYGGELVKRHLDALGLQDQTGTQVDHNEYQERNQSQAAAFLIQGTIHKIFLLFSCPLC